MNRRAALFACIIAFGALSTSGCEGGSEPGQARPAPPSEPTFSSFGDFELHYNAVRTDELTAAVARAYGIERSANRVLLNVALLR